MKPLSRAAILREALRLHGELTRYELIQYTGIDEEVIGGTLKHDINNGTIVRGWKGKKRTYRLLAEGETPVKISQPAPSTQQSTKPVLFESVGRRFPDVAAQAAEREKAADYDNAAPLWLQAKDLAALDINIEYCYRRAQFCVAALERHWGCVEVGA